MPITAVTPAEFAHWMQPLQADGVKLAVAVSGGADSMALALLAAGYAPGRITALMVDHGLRAESAAEAAQVAMWMHAHGITHHTLHWQPDKRTPAAAREARYRLMSEYCATRGIRHLLLAHHLDDQAETLLLRIRRGSHIEGLSAMRPRTERSGITLLRPLLACPKTRLIATLQARGQAWVEDPSNRNLAYDRNRLRALLAALPEYETIARRLGCAAEAIATIHDTRAQTMHEWLEQHSTPHKTGISIAAADFTQLIEDDAFFLLSTLLRRIGGKPHPPRFEDLQRLRSALADGHCKRTLAQCAIEHTGQEIRILPEIRLKPRAPHAI